MMTRLAFLVILAMHHRDQSLMKVYLACLFNRSERISNVLSHLLFECLGLGPMDRFLEIVTSHHQGLSLTARDSGWVVHDL